MTINVVDGKMLVGRVVEEEISKGGILVSTKEKEGVSEHVVYNSGVEYLKDGDVVVCEAPSLTWKHDMGDNLRHTPTPTEVGITDATNALLRRVGDKWRPLRKDILLQLKSSNSTRGGMIYIKDNPDREKLQTFQVVDVGPDCVDTTIGDLVVVPWLRITPPFTIKGYETYGVTSEEEVLAVVEG